MMGLRPGEDIRDLIAMTETKFLGLKTKDDPVSKSKKVAILIMTLSSLTQYTAISVSINTMKSSDLTWNYVTMTFTEES